MVKRLGLLLLWSGLGACTTTEPRTQLLLVADTDIAELDTIAFEVKGPDDAESQRRQGPAHGAEPASLALEHTQGKLGPFTVTALGYIGTVSAISRTHEVFFVPGKTLTVPMHLVAECRAETSCAELVCSERGCMSVMLSEHDLQPYSADLPRLEGGTGDAGSGGDDAGSSGDLIWCEPSWVDTQSDPNHCGACEAPCSEAPTGTHAEGRLCNAGTCALACEHLWGDCDDNPDNGCERALTSKDDCGACRHRCKGAETCSNGVCMR